MSLSACAHTNTHTHKCAQAHTHLYIYSQRVPAHLNVPFSVKPSLLPVGENNCCNLVLCFHVSLSWYKQSCLLMSYLSVNLSLLFDSEQSSINLYSISTQSTIWHVFGAQKCFLSEECRKGKTLEIVVYLLIKELCFYLLISQKKKKYKS